MNLFHLFPLVTTKNCSMNHNFKKVNLILFFTFLTVLVNGQHFALTFQEAEKQSIGYAHLDSIYKSAVHADTALAVFKTEKEQDEMGKAYVRLLKDFGKFLSKNKFEWDRVSKCFNRIYFNTDGSIDYFLYDFLYKNVKPEDQLSQDKQMEFNRLLNLFIQDYKISLTAETKFAQCSPVTYQPK